MVCCKSGWSLLSNWSWVPHPAFLSSLQEEISLILCVLELNFSNWLSVAWCIEAVSRAKLYNRLVMRLMTKAASLCNAHLSIIYRISCPMSRSSCVSVLSISQLCLLMAWKLCAISWNWTDGPPVRWDKGIMRWWCQFCASHISNVVFSSGCRCKKNHLLLLIWLAFVLHSWRKYLSRKMCLWNKSVTFQKT